MPQPTTARSRRSGSATTPSWPPRTLADPREPPSARARGSSAPREETLDAALLAAAGPAAELRPRARAAAAGSRRRSAACSWSRGPSPPTRQLREPLEALATQLALALEGARLAEKIHLQRSEARFASLVQRSSDLITVVGSDATIVYQSPSSERVLGYPRTS